jgi:pimeloyl-ACP methyl ester carboxylesterase
MRAKAFFAEISDFLSVECFKNNRKLPQMSNTILFEGQSYTIEQSGEGDVALVLLHGFCFDRSVWATMIPELSEYRVITLDHSGMGNAPLHREHSIFKMAALVREVLDQLEIKRCFLIGHSMGGYIGACFASNFPERLLGLILMNTHPYEDSPAKKDNRQKTSEFIEKHGVAKFVQQLIPALFSEAFVLHQPMVLRQYIDKASAYDAASVIACQRAMIERASQAVGLNHQKFPVHFIVGKQDTAVPLELAIAQTVLPEATLVTYLPGDAHMAMLEAPLETTASIKEFIQFALSKHA